MIPAYGIRHTLDRVSPRPATVSLSAPVGCATNGFTGFDRCTFVSVAFMVHEAIGVMTAYTNGYFIDAGATARHRLGTPSICRAVPDRVQSCPLAGKP